MNIRSLLDRVRTFRRNQRLRGSSEDVFTRIYQRKLWRGKESRSGRGSELSYTKNLRRELPGLVKQYEVARFLDAPCGDFNWMQHVVPGLGVEYVGGDIVKDLVERNQRKFGGPDVSFRHMDVTCDPLPAADLMMVRDCLFHLCYSDIYRFLQNFCRSDIRLLLTTTHNPSDGENCDIKSGDFRHIHIFSPPFCFPQPLHQIDDWVPPDPARKMCLFSAGQVAFARSAMKQTLGQ